MRAPDPMNETCSFEISLYPAKRRAFIAYTGAISSRAAIESLVRTLDHPLWRPGFDTLSDLCGITGIAGEYAEIPAMVRIWDRYHARMGLGRDAFFTENKVIHGMSQVMAVFANMHSSRKAKPFWTRAEAEAWLDAPHVRADDTDPGTAP